MTASNTIAEPRATRATLKADATRSRIYEVALQLFREKGFEQTTMRDIARQADVALGAAYYHFGSKDAIVLAFYREMKERGHQPTLDALAKHRKLRDRIRVVLEKRFDLLAPNLKFLGALFKHSPDADDPLSPFSEQNKPIRDEALELFSTALDGADVKVPPDLALHLPRLLWMYHLSLILFWIYDRSEEKKSTMLLMDKSLSLIATLIRISGLPLMRPVRRSVLEVLKVAAV